MFQSSVLSQLLLSLASRPASPQPDPTALLMLLLASQGGPPAKDRKKPRSATITLRAYVTGHYLADAEKDLSASGATAKLLQAALNHLERAIGHDPTLAEFTPEVVDRFHAYLSGLVQSKKFSRATADKQCRHLWPVLRHARRRRMLARVPQRPQFAAVKSRVQAWSIDQLEAIEATARALEGQVVGPRYRIPRAIWWTALHLVLSRSAGRINAVMCAAREDFSDGALLLREENQKSGHADHPALCPATIAAVEKLLASHHEPLIFPWPIDAARPGEIRNYRRLRLQFRRDLLLPNGLDPGKGVAFKQYRRTGASLLPLTEAQAQLGHSTPSVTRGYQDRRRVPVCGNLARVFRGRSAAAGQLNLF